MKSYDYLISYNIKPSVQRIAIMDYLLAHKTHPSIDEIYLALCKDIPTLSKTTVYNTLKLFVEHGAALMLTIDEKNKISHRGKALERMKEALKAALEGNDEDINRK